MSKSRLRALLLDFDGVLADSEPIHLEMFQKVLKEEGVELDREDYYEKYLGLDDRACFEAVYRDQGRKLDPALREGLITRKNRHLLAHVQGRSVLLPGVSGFVRKAAEKYFLAIVSGALRSEIVAILCGGGLEKIFSTIVAADDIAKGKPDPEGFERGLQLLNRDQVPASEILLPDECLVIEDSPWGIEAARKAGMRCVAVETSYSKDRLRDADLVFKGLWTFDWALVEGLFSGSATS